MREYPASMESDSCPGPARTIDLASAIVALARLSRRGTRRSSSAR